MSDWFTTFETLFSKAVKALCTFFLAAIFVMFILNVFVRFVPVYNFTQTDDWIQAALIWMIFLGSAELVRTKSHFVVDVAVSKVSHPVLSRVIRTIVIAIELTTYLVVFWYGIVWVLRSNAYMQSIPWLQIRYVYMALPVSAFFMALFSLKDLVLTVTGKGGKDAKDELRPGDEA